MSSETPVVSVRDLTLVFRAASRQSSVGGVRAVDRVDLDVLASESVGVVGESGCGKSSLIRLITGLEEPTSGTVAIQGESLTSRRRAKFRGLLQMVFQDSASSLDPRRRIGESIAEPLWERRGPDVKERVSEAMDLVGLDSELAQQYPHELSGGQQQRVCIARALVSEPILIAFDEPTSALDVSLQAQVLQLIVELQRRIGFSSIFVSHDIASVEAFSDRVVVMYLGSTVEIAPTEQIQERALHPYTVALRSAVPVPDPTVARRRISGGLVGEIPDPSNPPGGCPFHTRCPIARPVCATDRPPLEEKRPLHLVACHFPGEFEGFTNAEASTASTYGEIT